MHCSKFWIQGESYNNCIKQIIEDLIQLYGFSINRDRILDIYQILTRGQPDFPIGYKPPIESILCEDGTPVEFSVVLDEVGSNGLRYEVENLHEKNNFQNNLAHNFSRAGELFHYCGEGYNYDVFTQIYKIMFESGVDFKLSPRFSVIFALGHLRRSVPDINIYFNPNAQGNDRAFQKIKNTLEILKFQYELTTLKKSLKILDNSIIKSVCIKFLYNGRNDVKIYLQPKRLSYDRMRKFLTEFGLAEYIEIFSHFNRKIMHNAKNYFSRSIFLTLMLHEDMYPGRPNIKFETYLPKYHTDDQSILFKILGVAQALNLKSQFFEKNLQVVTERIQRNYMKHSPGIFNILSIYFYHDYRKKIAVYYSPNLCATNLSLVRS